MRSRAKSVDCRGKENDGELEAFDGKQQSALKSAQTDKTEPVRKRKLAALNPSPTPAKVAKLNPAAESDASKSMNSVVATNCKLTNTLIDLTCKLSEKQLDYERLMIKYFAEKKEKWFLQQKVERRDRSIANLNRELKDFRESRFCNDLIEINDTESENKIGKYMCVYNDFLEHY